jgi:thiol-disulfide isomerase/thioredoxin
MHGMGRVAFAAAVAWALGAALAPGDASAQAASDDRLARLTRAWAAFDANDLSGQRWTAARLSGRVVVLDFWATWCAPCLADVPWLRRLHETGQAQVIGVSLDVGERRTLVGWLNRQRVDWPQVWEDRGYDGGLARQFNVSTLPASVLVNPAGRVVAAGLRGERLLAAVAALRPGASIR